MSEKTSVDHLARGDVFMFEGVSAPEPLKPGQKYLVITREVHVSPPERKFYDFEVVALAAGDAYDPGAEHLMFKAQSHPALMQNAMWKRMVRVGRMRIEWKWVSSLA